MNITVNGKAFVVESGFPLETFLKDRGFDPSRTVVAVNGSIVAGEDCGGIILKESDALDVMSFVGGG